MENTVSQAGGGAIVYALTAAIQKNRDYLSEVDGATGDGDHGVNMNKGFTKCREQLEGKQDDTGFSEALDILGDILLSEIGGSMGPLYGTFFMSMAESAAGKDQIGGQDYLDMLNAGLAGIRELVTTKAGDKTLLDVLIPAIDGFAAALKDGKDFGGALAALQAAADAGREATKDMVAKVGRASRLGERSRGFYDAGAVSCSIILNTLADSMRALLGSGKTGDGR